MLYNNAKSVILLAKHVHNNQKFAKVVILLNSELLLAIYVTAKMDIIKVFQIFVLNVTLPVKPVLIFFIIAKHVIH